MYAIAIADDHVLVREGIVGLINSFPNYRVVIEASNGKQLIDKLLPGSLPDLVIMDVSMPVMDGFVTTRWIKNAFPDLPVLALSMMDAENSVVEMLRSGARGYLLKDARAEELEMAMSSILKQGFYFNRIVSTHLLNSVNRGTYATAADKLLKLTQKERSFLFLLCTELSYQAIAAKLCISPRTLENYRDSISEKLGVKGRVGLMIFAFTHKFID